MDNNIENEADEEGDREEEHRGPFPSSTRASFSFPLGFMESHGPHGQTTNQ